MKHGMPVHNEQYFLVMQLKINTNSTVRTIFGAIASCVYKMPELIIKGCEKRLTDGLFEISGKFDVFRLRQAGQKV